MAGNPIKETYPLFSLSNSIGLGFEGSSRLPPPPPCVEVSPSEVTLPVTSNVDAVTIAEGLSLLKGRVNTLDVFGVSNSDLVPGKYEGGLKLWEGALDLVRNLQLEIRNGNLSFGGKRVLELGCGHGIPGIFACLEGAGVVHFQDFNAEVIQCLTIPNVYSNLKKKQLQSLGLLTTNAEMSISADVRFFAGDWGEVHQLLFHGPDDEHHKVKDMGAALDRCDGYDIILMAETVYSLCSLKNLYGLIKKCLCRPHGACFMSGKKHYFGVGGGTRQFLHIVHEDGVFEASLVAEVTDGSSNVREVWKLYFMQDEKKGAS